MDTLPRTTCLGAVGRREEAVFRHTKRGGAETSQISSPQSSASPLSKGSQRLQGQFARCTGRRDKERRSLDSRHCPYLDRTLSIIFKDTKTIWSTPDVEHSHDSRRMRLLASGAMHARANSDKRSSSTQHADFCFRIQLLSTHRVHTAAALSFFLHHPPGSFGKYSLFYSNCFAVCKARWSRLHDFV